MLFTLEPTHELKRSWAGNSVEVPKFQISQFFGIIISDFD